MVAKIMVVLGMVLMVGCGAAGQRDMGRCDDSQGKGDRVVKEQKAVVEEGSGDVIAFWQQRKSGKGGAVRLEAEVVPTKYAMYIEWPDDDWKPRGEQRLILYDNVAKRFWMTGDFEGYLKVLSRMPRGIEILQIDTCTVSRCHMRQAEWVRLERVMSERGMRWADSSVRGEGPMIVCTCETAGDFVYPGGDVAAGAGKKK